MNLPEAAAKGMQVQDRTEAATADDAGPQMRSDAAFAALLQETAAEIDRQLAVFLESDLESGPHKSRVALRRLTTALDAFAPILKHKARTKHRRAAKRIFRQLGAVRDADVYLARRIEAGADGDEEARLTRKAADLRRKIRDKLRRDKAVAFAPALLRDLGEDRLLKTGRTGLAARAQPVGQFAGQALEAAWTAGLRHGADIAALEDEARHEFRKDMKSLRYTAEFFEGFWPESRWAAFHAALEDLQDALGLLNDMALARRQGGAPARRSKDEVRALDEAADLWRRLTAAGPFWRTAG